MSSAAPRFSAALVSSQVLQLKHGQLGCSYHALFAKYLQGAEEVSLDDPTVQTPFQLNLLLHFVELLIKVGVKRFTLLTETPRVQSEYDSWMGSLRQICSSANENGTEMRVMSQANIASAEIRTRNGWQIKLSHGIDFYLPVRSEGLSAGTFDLDLRPCQASRIEFMPLISH